MERRQLECLLSVVETGSFHGAAERLYITQSAVSQAIKALEKDLGELLLDRAAARRGERVGLTAAGELWPSPQSISTVWVSSVPGSVKLPETVTLPSSSTVLLSNSRLVICGKRLATVTVVESLS